MSNELSVVIILKKKYRTGTEKYNFYNLSIDMIGCIKKLQKTLKDQIFEKIFSNGVSAF